MWPRRHSFYVVLRSFSESSYCIFIEKFDLISTPTIVDVAIAHLANVLLADSERGIHALQEHSLAVVCADFIREAGYQWVFPETSPEHGRTTSMRPPDEQECVRSNLSLCLGS